MGSGSTPTASAMARIKKRALRQDGFSWGKQTLFDKTEPAERFFEVVLGPIDRIGIEELRLRVETQAKELFHICLQYHEFYTAVKASDVFWGFVIEQWDTLQPVEPEELAAFVAGFQAARENSNPGVPTGELSGVVDKFIKMHKAMLIQAMVPTPMIAARPSAIIQVALSLFKINLEASDPRTATTWPPQYYTWQEAAWLSQNNVLSQVHGLTPKKRITSAADIPEIPNEFAHPLDVRLFLAFTALTNFRSDRKASLCLTPIMFWDDEERTKWYQPTGAAAKFGWTTWEFSHWAKEEFDRGREAVVGLCHFHRVTADEPWKYVAESYDPTKHGRRDVYWSQTCPRMSVGMLIRKLRGGNYEFIMEDAFYYRVSSNPIFFKERYGLQPDSGMDFKAALLEDVHQKFNVTSFWHGGEVPNAFEHFGIKLRDSVSTSCSFVYLAVQGKVPTRAAGLQKWGFTRNIPQDMKYSEKMDIRKKVLGEVDADDESGRPRAIRAASISRDE
ncbi:hypothetical protein SAMD00023353_2200980 [Rosellinia necatrix]|uniref:Uncharacterized protein n=1 Tax=Rosellinia necatrix TaxID=77044 RepID=A0A1S7UUR7_ROSNE|nr:hypothetical protein SAMD00023353_2200980 [Rosellinia necatrix]